jgi:hypothetical protein
MPLHLSLYQRVNFQGILNLIALHVQIDRAAVGGCLESFLIWVSDVSKSH